jgi:hypothetical protein
MFEMKHILSVGLTLLAAAAFAAGGAVAEIKPQPYYGNVAQEVVKRIGKKHVLRRQFDDE